MSKKPDTEQPSDEAKPVRTVTVVAAEPRRRCGMRFKKGENIVEFDAFDETQWREIVADPVLSVRPE